MEQKRSNKVIILKKKASEPSPAVLLSNHLIERATGVKDFHGVEGKKTKRKQPLTLRQQRVVALVQTGAKSKAEILRKAGYENSSVRKPKLVFDSPAVKEEIAPILERLIKHRDKVLEGMEAKVNTAGYTALSITLSNLNKDIELLAGRPTENIKHELPDEEKAMFEELIAKAKKRKQNGQT